MSSSQLRALAVNPQDAAQEIVASGFIVRVPPVDAAASSDSSAVHRLADQGLWYDALAEVDGEMKTRPADASAMRSALLRQVGLDAVANAL